LDREDGAYNLAIVIGSGGVLCAASIGMWKALQGEGIQASMAVGCSGGSIYAAMIALGYSVEQTEEMSLNLWTSDLFEGYVANLRSALSGEGRFTEKSGLIDDGPINERLEGIFRDKTFSETRIPLFVVATDLYTGEGVVLSEGRIFDAIRASIAIPMVFPPWELSERLLVDGAVSNPLPVDVAIKEGGDIITAMGFELPTRSRMRTYSSVANHFNSIYMNNVLRASFAFHNLAHHSEIIPIIPTFERPIGSFDVHQIPYIIERGLEAAEEQLPYIRRLTAVSLQREDL
jgi:NTE family protein